MANAEPLPRSTVRDFLEGWLKRKETEAGEKTRIRYGVTVSQFLEHLGSRAQNDIMHLAPRDIVKFRDDLAKRLTPGTVNTSLKILRAALNTAKKDGYIDQNAAERVDLLSANAPNRRPFTHDELTKVLKAADKEWRTMILVALYSGLRLGDICSLTWQNVDLLKGAIELVVGKTEKPIEIPIAKKLLPHLQNLPATDDPKQPLFPTSHADYAKNYYNGLLSKRFHAILVKAGLTEKRKTRNTGEGRSVKHRTDTLSFHCLRHNFVSALKDSGASDAIARDLAGHESPAVNRRYSHIAMNTKRTAVDNLPDFTK
jgi:integrase